jgi:hypothetical protein
MAFLLRFYRKRELSWLWNAHRVALFSLLFITDTIGDMQIQKKR